MGARHGVVGGRTRRRDRPPRGTGGTAVTARLVVDLDAFAANLRVIRGQIAPAHHMLVVKDDAYGHGLLPVVRRAHAEGLRWFGAFDTATGRAVREALGPDVRVFVWMLESTDDLHAAVEADLDLGVGDDLLLEDLAALGPAPAGSLPPRVHLKIDTGLPRNGLRPDQWPDAVGRAAEQTGTAARRARECQYVLNQVGP